METPDRIDLTLYYASGTRATRPRWLLEELGVPYRLVRMNLRVGEHKNNAFRAINPLAKVPALKDGGIVLTESLAICLHLADRRQEKDFAPVLGTPARAHYYKWMAYSVATLEPAILEIVRRRKIESGREKSFSKSPALTEFNPAAAMVESALEDRKFVLGARFTAVDVMIGSLMIWANSMGLIETNNHTLEWLERLTSRPAYLEATSN